MALAAFLGTASYAVTSAGAFAITQRTDPTLGTLERNRYIAAGVVALGGILLAVKKSPVFGAAVAAGAVVSAIGYKATVAIQGALSKSSSADRSQVPVAAVYGQMGGYEAMGASYQPMGEYRALGAVYGNMGAVYGNMGSFVPAPPWTGNPY